MIKLENKIFIQFEAETSMDLDEKTQQSSPTKESLLINGMDEYIDFELLGKLSQTKPAKMLKWITKF